MSDVTIDRRLVALEQWWARCQWCPESGGPFDDAQKARDWFEEHREASDLPHGYDDDFNMVPYRDRYRASA